MLAKRQRQGSLYARDLPPIRLVDAEAEPEADRLFIEPSGAPGTQPAYPRITLRTSVLVDGFVFDVTFNDTSLSEAAAILRRRGCTPATPVAPTLAPQVPAATVEAVAPAAAIEPEAPADLLAARTMPPGLPRWQWGAYYGQLYDARRARGQWLRESRKELSIPQKELARRVGVKGERICAYERGDSCPGEVWLAIEHAIGRRYEPAE